MDLKITNQNALIFDFDGTLVDTEAYHYKAISVTLESMGINYVPYEDHLKTYTGTGTKTILIKELDKHKKSYTQDQLLELLIIKKAIYENMTEIAVSKRIKGAKRFIKRAKAKNIKMAIVSGGNADVILKIMELSGIPNLFDLMITSDDKLAPKPSPEAFLKAAEKLNVKPEDCIVFEDALNGIKGAIEAKMTPVALSTYIEAKKFKDLKSDILVIEDFKNEQIVL